MLVSSGTTIVRETRLLFTALMALLLLQKAQLTRVAARLAVARVAEAHRNRHATHIDMRTSLAATLVDHRRIVALKRVLVGRHLVDVAVVALVAQRVNQVVIDARHVVYGRCVVVGDSGGGGGAVELVIRMCVGRAVLGDLARVASECDNTVVLPPSSIGDA
jgi:3-deoxy-D-manno-octulosonate 8-phosphate phosphatase KdsC-like HAD superfamily phosphatase